MSERSLQYFGTPSEETLRRLASPEVEECVGRAALRDIVQMGWAEFNLTADEAASQQAVYENAKEFFDQSVDAKMRYSDGKLTNGYRYPGAAYNNGDPQNESDENDSLLYWNPDLAAAIPHADEIAPFLDSLEAYRAGAMDRVMRKLYGGLAWLYNDERILEFKKASVLQVNSFGSSERELLQTPHEDGVLATAIWTSAPGLEVYPPEGHPDEIVPLTPASGKVVVMPGGIMRHMTGGEIGPLYHQARNHGEISLARKSIMYFSCPDIHNGHIPPHVLNQSNYFTKAVDLIRSSTDMFGLPTDFVKAAHES